MSSGQYDVIIVGGGPAGCVLAARLTEDSQRSVLLIEAGPDYGTDPANWPSEMIDPIGVKPDTHSWGYVNHVVGDNPPLSLPRARVLGGSSAINGCIWLRGSRADYDDWEARGNPGWGFADLLPYFKRAEADPIQPGDLHGSGGLVPVFRLPAERLSAIERGLIATAEELDIDIVEDLNGRESQTPAVGPTPKNVAQGARMNAAFTYLAAARGRPNLTLVTDALVDRVLLDGPRARGVRAADGRQFMGREIIISGGTYGSPAILLRSGIGPAKHLSDVGIEVIHDLPGVGENLMDHPRIGPGMLAHPAWASYQPAITALNMQRLIVPDAAPSAIVYILTMIRARSRQVTEEIDLHFYPLQTYSEHYGAWTFMINTSLQYSRSCGTVRLTSADPDAPLAIDHNYLSDPLDLEALCDGVELASRIVGTPPLSRLLQPLPDAAPAWNNRDELRELVRAVVGTTYHPSSTCKMGPADDPLAVVDQECRVHGLDGLRVVDASVFPYIPRCNLHVPTVAVAEKAADLIRQG